MAKIRHIALTTKDPNKVAAFYKEAFDMEEIRRSDNGAVFLTDGYINLAILNHKTNDDADVGSHGSNFNGIHHIGFFVENLEEQAEKLDKAGGDRLTPTVAAGTGGLFGHGDMGPSNAEVKFGGPDGVIIDMSESGWLTSA